MSQKIKLYRCEAGVVAQVIAVPFNNHATPVRGSEVSQRNANKHQVVEHFAARGFVTKDRLKATLAAQRARLDPRHLAQARLEHELGLVVPPRAPVALAIEQTWPVSEEPRA